MAAYCTKWSFIQANILPPGQERETNENVDLREDDREIEKEGMSLTL